MADINRDIGNTKEPFPAAGAFVGYNAIVSIADTPVSRIQQLSFSIDNNITQVFVVSSRTPLNIETSMVIKGTIRKIFFNSSMLRLAMGVLYSGLDLVRTAEFGSSDVEGMMGGTDLGTPFFASNSDFRRLPPISILCQLSIGDSTTDPYGIKLANVKFNTYDMSVNANTVVLENVSFFAESVSLTVPVGGGGGSAGAAGEF